MDLIPSAYRAPGYWLEELSALLGGEVRAVPVPIPHDCRDGFHGAYWRRPGRYLEQRVRDGISLFAALPAEQVAHAVARLRADLEDGTWHERNAALLDLDGLDLGYAVVVAEFD